MANTVYSNAVIETKANDLLTTALNTRNLMTIDDSLAESAGMTKNVITYTYSGEAEELAAGAKNTNRGSISHITTPYTVKRVQQVFDYLDDDFYQDPTIVDNMLKGANQVMVNKMTSDFFGECAKANLGSPFAGSFGYEAIVDGISTLNLEDESAVYVVIPNAWKAQMRKDPDYVSARQGEVVYNGQIGTVCGIPVVATKALTDAAYVMTNEAVKLLMKKDIEVEQDRDKEAKQNTVILSTYYICALHDKTKICKLTKSA